MKGALLWVLLLLATLAVLVAGWELQHRWQAPLPVPELGHTFTVAKGDSLRRVATRLHREGVLPHPDLLVIYARLTGLDASIRRGEYLLSPGVQPRTLLDQLVAGQVLQYQVTLPEGITVAQALALLHSDPVLQQQLEGAADPRLLDLVAPRESVEGLFLPETYRFERGDSDLDILTRAHRAMLVVLAEEWELRASDLPYESPYEALIMASIIERETGLPSERQQIAGVFVRRLQLGMRLQTDPTIIYGLGAAFDGNLVRSHLRDGDNIYNTYRHHGLPPTPIALPGRAALHAALQPAEGDSLFFVARGDGSHEFNANLEDHERAVRKYQLERRENYRSRPGTQ